MCIFNFNKCLGRHADTGVYTIQAKNKYGVGESSARLDILLRPEIEGLKDVTAMPYEETTFITKIQANPIAEVQWSVTLSLILYCHSDRYEFHLINNSDV